MYAKSTRPSAKREVQKERSEKRSDRIYFETTFNWVYIFYYVLSVPVSTKNSLACGRIQRVWFGTLRLFLNYFT